jgi:predicted neuraminidase
VVELKGGDVMAAWFSGTREGASDVAIYGARQHNGVWSAPVELARADNVACWNPVLFHTKNGRLWLYYKFGLKPSSWAGARKWSDDEGRTWSAEERLPAGILGPIKDKPLVLSDGTIVSGSSVENGKWNAWIERSTDDGKSWTKFGPITVPESADMPDAAAQAAIAKVVPPASGADADVHTKVYLPSKTTVGIIQPSVVWLGEHHLRFYARSHSRSASIAVADSTDDGKTWTQARFIDLPNPNSGIDAVRLKDGRIVLVFNNSYNQRTPLNLAVSTDGEHFKVFKTLEDGPGQYSYPAIVQASNGDLLVTYSWRRETIKFVRTAPPSATAGSASIK